VSLRAGVLRALGSVFDPELDEPITELGFVGRCGVGEDGDVEVLLRLPTPQCAPNFAFLMAADAHDAVCRVPGVRAVRVELIDHYTGREINTAVARGANFAEAFPGETRGQLDALRELFRRKALGELSGPDAVRCRALRLELGIDASDDAPAFVRGDGTPVGSEELVRFRRTAGLTALSLETNGGMCRDLLRVRYEDHDRKEVAV
jgi:metal-sulfur cluster biosynthetic enzyme